MSNPDPRAFKKELEYLSKFKGRHTELISVYVPPGYDLSKVIQQLEQEYGTATNIKSKSTRVNVMDALTRIIVYLKQLGTLPKKGIAIFAGNVSEKEGGRDIEIFTVDPPEPIGVKVYRCDQKFFLDPLWTMTESKEVYGLLLVERSGATIGLMKGKKTTIVKEPESLVFGKFRAGGQSAHRFEQQRENLLKAFYKQVGELSSKVFLENKVNGILVGGPGPTKEQFLRGDFLDYRLKDKVLAVKDVSEGGITGLHELVERSRDVLKEAEITREKNLVQLFLEKLSRGEPVAYGEQEVREALAKKSVEILLLSEGLDWKRVRVSCSCGFARAGTVHDIEKFKRNLSQEKCPKCGASNLSIKGEMELVEELKELGESSGARVEFISTETPEGQQLLGLGGIAAILRF